MADLAKSYIGKKYGKSYKSELDAGDKARSEFYQNAGISPEDADQLDRNAKYNIDYIKPKGAVSTDEPPVDIAPDPSPLMNKPVYESLLNRGPSSVDESISNPAIDISGEAPQKGRITDIEAQEANKPTPREARVISNATGDMMVGASHALLGLLSGNYNRAAMEYGKANEYVAGQRKQDLANMSKLVKTVGPDGKPIYTPTVEAADMKAYEAPKLGGGAAGSFQLAQMYDPDSNKYFTVRHNSRTGEMLDMSGNPITPPANAIVRPVAPKLFQTEDVQGTKTEHEYNPYRGTEIPGKASKSNNKTNPLVITPGLGAKYGVGTKGQAEQIEKGYGKAQEEYQNLSGALVDAKSARQSLDKTQDPRVLAESVYSMVRAVESKGVLTDQDFENITGMRYMSWYRNMDNMLKTKAYGDIEELRNSFKGLADKIQNKIQTRMKSIPERFAPDTREGQKGLEEVVPKMKIDKKAQAELIKAERIASKKYGKGTEKYNKFMEFAKDSLGQ